MAATAARGAQQSRLGLWREGMKNAARRSLLLLGGLAVVAATLWVAVALISYRPSDPALNTAAAGPVLNRLGTPGAYISDLLLTLMGPPIAFLTPLVLVWG